ncbi:MAG: type II secretion system minor pseudopilin GspI [Gammaproteobacteria bacterium]
MKKADGKAAFSSRGFTLLEILVALGIAAIAIVLVLDSLLVSTFRTGYLRDRTFASWIGHNQITRYRLAETLPDAGDEDGEIEYAGRLWHWYSVISETPVENLRRVEVTVGPADDPDLGFVTIVGFLGLPTPRSNNPGWVLRPGVPPPTDGGQRPGNGDTT